MVEGLVRFRESKPNTIRSNRKVYLMGSVGNLVLRANEDVDNDEIAATMGLQAWEQIYLMGIRPG